MDTITPPLALASLSGESDADWATRGEGLAGVAFLGGIALDEPTRRAAEAVVERDRSEFLPEDPFGFIEDQLDQLTDIQIRAGVNVRAATPEPVQEAATRCQRYDAILEVNAHCRQPECTTLGCGQALLRRPDALTEQVAAAAEVGVPVSVKVRTEVPGVNLPELAARLDQAGTDIIHVDAMDSRPVVGEVVEQTAATVIANNNVRTRRDIEEYAGYGADLVSIGRPSTDDRKLRRIAKSVSESRLG